jgi:nanoRNase/pAp phosphatase (c-di-AMP/oligoRNAs hydrolase)
MPAQTVIKVRRDTAANWTTANSVLSAGEVGLETDTNRFKFGNGTTAWASLQYYTSVTIDTKANWISTNPILPSGYIGLESDTNKFKFGNGTDTWTALKYAGGSETLNSFLLMGA